MVLLFKRPVLHTNRPLKCLHHMVYSQGLHCTLIPMHLFKKVSYSNHDFLYYILFFHMFYMSYRIVIVPVACEKAKMAYLGRSTYAYFTYYIFQTSLVTPTFFLFSLCAYHKIHPCDVSRKFSFQEQLLQNYPVIVTCLQHLCVKNPLSQLLLLVGFWSINKIEDHLNIYMEFLPTPNAV
jgi:hypothetical protein